MATKMTQSFKLYRKLKAARNGASTVELSKVIGRPPAQTPSYILELVRVYGAKIAYNKETKRYSLLNDPKVPASGATGRRLGHSLNRATIQHVALRQSNRVQG
jgi:hypothetical protein